jgi:hypothetical protein
VAALVRSGESRTAVRTLSELGKLLRWVLEDEPQLVPLRRELDLDDRSLRIERIPSSTHWWRMPCTTG